MTVSVPEALASERREFPLPTPARGAGKSRATGRGKATKDKARTDPAADIPEEIRTKKLVVVDAKGRDRLTMDTVDDRMSRFLMRNEEGWPVVVVSASDADPSKGYPAGVLVSMEPNGAKEGYRLLLDAHSGSIRLVLSYGRHEIATYEAKGGGPLR